MYIYQQIDNILEFWQHVSAVKKPSLGQNRTISRYNGDVHSMYKHSLYLEIVLFWPDYGVLQPKHVAKILKYCQFDIYIYIYMLCFRRY